MELKNYNKVAIVTSDREISYSEMMRRITMFASHSPKGQDKKIVVFSENREGWIYALFAGWTNNSVVVPIDAGSTVEDVAYILNDCTPDCIWTSEKCKEVLQSALAQTGREIPVNIIDDYERASLSNETEARFTTNDSDVAFIIYTSGTTGNPKGVMLSYSNLEAMMRGVVYGVPIFCESRRTLILLPLHHILPLMGTAVIPIISGGGVAISPSMTGPDIMATLCKGKVAIMIGVPRLWQMLYGGIKKKIDEKAITRALFSLCQKAGSPTLSRIIFSSVHKKMGGNIRFCVSGGAALDKEIGQGLRTLGIDVLEGYGMTETAPIISFTRPDDIIPGCVGLPLPDVECKLVDGELCAKGPNVMLGYYNRPEETAQVIDKDGYIHTGDLARIDEKGRIYITGRKKEIIVLSNGKNVQPNEIEFKLEKYDDMIKECAITDQNDMLVAIIVPQPQFAEGKTDEEMQEILKREVVEPYNLSVENYKKVMRIHILHGELPRTRLEKIQRFKLKDLLTKPVKTENLETSETPETSSPEYLIIKRYIESEKKLPVSLSSHLETDLAMDSLDKVSMQEFLCKSFGVDVEVEKMTQLGTVEALVNFIEKSKTHIEETDIDWHKTLQAHSTALSSQLPTAWTFETLQCCFKAFFTLYNRLEIKGIERIPATGPFIIAPNHQSFLDGPLVIAGIPSNLRKQCYFYATEEHVKGKFLKGFARRNNIILMERKNLKNSILKLGEVLKQGKNVCIFPEGRRCNDGQVGKFKKMFAILSKELNVPIIPVRLTGAFEALPRTSNFVKPHKITVEYLYPIDPTKYNTYEELSDAVRNAIIE